MIMIYKNKTQSQNLSVYKQRNPSFLAIFSDYDKHTLKKKAGFYFRITIKEKKRKKTHCKKKIHLNTETYFDSKMQASSQIFIKRRLEKKNNSFECKFHEDQVSFTSQSHRVVGYTSHGDLFTKHV